MDPVADRIFLETTRRYAPPRLARDDVAIALHLAQVEPGKPIADLGCGFGRHLAAFIEQGHPHPLGVDRSALLLDEARTQARTARLIRADLRALPLHAGSPPGELRPIAGALHGLADAGDGFPAQAAVAN